VDVPGGMDYCSARALIRVAAASGSLVPEMEELHMKRAAFVLLSLLCLAIPAIAPAGPPPLQKDDPTCKDHPLLTRMPTYWIRGCKQSEFDGYDFKVTASKAEHVEGKSMLLFYYPQASATVKPSQLQILRNYENAVKALGGSLVWVIKDRETLRLARDGKDIWIEVIAEFTGKYSLHVVEREAMKQDVMADAASLSSGLKATGHIAVEGIFFDTGKAELKPESTPALEQVARLLKDDAGLKLYVVGHTDNVGGLESNMKLSQARAEAVVQALVKSHGVSAARLKGFGNGPYAPVASNDAEEGRARNRRVELVKQ
jgi:OmpA-OmpF porin, OOP family